MLSIGKSIFVLCGFSSSFCSTVATTQSVAPVGGVEVGKVKVVSLSALKSSTTSIPVKQYEEIPDEAVVFMKSFRSHLVHPREMERNSTFRPADVSATDLAHFTAEGVYPEGPTKTGPWTSSARVFRRDDNALVILHEWDYVKDGGGIMMVKELMNARVGNGPARLALKKSPSGTVVSELTWASPQRFYTLTVLDDVSSAGKKKYDVNWLINIASRLK